ncbi:MAG: response regulator [Muricoprocola sp.]
MYKLIIAEDDEILLEGLTWGIDWQKMDISVVASVNDGIYVVDKIEETKADILLTDIRMSQKNGLEVLKEVHEYHPNFPVIMLTAYEEFEYVKKALQFGAIDYLLKPVNIVQLSEVMEKAKAKINEQEKVRKVQWKSILNQCLQGKFREKKDEEIMKEITGMNIKEWSIVEIIPNFVTGQTEEIETTLTKYAAENNFYYTDFEVGHFLIVCCAEADLLNKRRTFLDKLKEALWDEKGCRISILVGSRVTHASDLYLSFQDIKKLREYQFCEEFGGSLEIKDIRKYEDQTASINKLLLNNIVNIISLGKVELIPECVKKLKERLRKAGNNSLLNMAYSLSIIYEGINDKIKKMEVYDTGFQELYTDILSKKNLDEAMNAFEKIATQIAEKIQKEQNNSGKTVAYQTKKYIDDNYMHSNLRISVIAKELGLSPNYLSKLFMEETGENFSDYLTAVRMKEAQKLLIYSNYTTQEIAQRIGYDNVSYFSVLFKKYTGVTAGQYRKNIKN